MSSTHLSILIAALGVVAMGHRVYADEQSAEANSSPRVIADGISFKSRRG